MKIERSKNTSKNIVFGSILKIYQIVMPFIIRIGYDISTWRWIFGIK